MAKAKALYLHHQTMTLSQTGQGQELKACIHACVLLLPLKVALMCAVVSQAQFDACVLLALDTFVVIGIKSQAEVVCIACTHLI